MTRTRGLTFADHCKGFDGIMHMCDEVRQARTRVPRSMISSVVSNGTMQALYMITILFTIGDVDRVSAAPLPILEVYYQATGSRVSTNIFAVLFIYIIFMGFFNILASVSRLAWAFSRDHGLPFSYVFAKVHPTLKMPVNALCLVSVIIVLLALINIASSTAFNAFISLPALALYISYLCPIIFILWRRLSSGCPGSIPWDPFT